MWLHYRNSPIAATSSSSLFKQSQVRTVSVDVDVTLNAAAGIAAGSRSSSNNNNSNANMNSSSNTKGNSSSSSNSSNTTVPRSSLLQQYGSHIESKHTPVSYIAVLLTAQSLYAWSRLEAHMQALLLYHCDDQLHVTYAR
jgi:hypothetical protein